MTSDELPRELENPIRNSVVEILGSMGIKLWRRNVAGVAVNGRFFRCADPGQSDLWGISTGTNQGMTRAVHWEIETKAHRKRPATKQLLWLKYCAGMGCVAFWGDNVNTIVSTAKAVLMGGRIAWRNGPGYHTDGADFDVETES